MLAVLLVFLAFHTAFADFFGLPIYECSGTHFEFGQCLGKNSAALMRKRYDASPHFQNLYAWSQTTDGAQTMATFVATNSKAYPQFFEEMKGIALGADWEYEKVLIMTLDDELTYFAPPDEYRMTACSDYLIHDYSSDGNLMDWYIAHNEDNLIENLNITFIVYGVVNDDPPFMAYSYAGELLTQAFGYNEYITFTSDYVHPANPVLGGIGRNFIGRDLLRQTNGKSALAVVSQDGQCGGHNYQIVEWRTGQMTGAEVAYDALHAFTPINQDNDWTFHANRYIHLNISQIEDDTYTSSVHREARAAELGRPNDLNDMLDYLGDHEDEDWPIYKTGQKDDYTLHTYGVDVPNCKWSVYGDNPKDRNQLASGTVKCVDPLL